MTQILLLRLELPDIESELKRDDTPPKHISHRMAELSLQPYLSRKLATLGWEILEGIVPVLALGRRPTGSCTFKRL